MAKSNLAALEERVTKLETELAELRAKGSAPRRGPWQPSSKLQAAKAEYLRRTAAGERCKIVGGEVVAY